MVAAQPSLHGSNRCLPTKVHRETCSGDQTNGRPGQTHLSGGRCCSSRRPANTEVFFVSLFLFCFFSSCLVFRRRHSSRPDVGPGRHLPPLFPRPVGAVLPQRQRAGKRGGGASAVAGEAFSAKKKARETRLRWSRNMADRRCRLDEAVKDTCGDSKASSCQGLPWVTGSVLPCAFSGSCRRR